MTGEAWAYLTAVSTGTLGMLGAVLIEQIRSRRKVEQVGQQVGAAAEAARDAADLARPTGNGYAGRTEAGIAAAVAASNANAEKLEQVLVVLERVERQAQITDRKVDRHLQDHASADVHHRH